MRDQDHGIEGLRSRQDERHQVLEWRAERIGWGVIALVLAAAVAGLLGPGPLSRGVAREPQGLLWVEYGRMERHQAEAVLKIHVAPAAAREGRVGVWIARGFVEGVDIQRINPRPESEEAEAVRQVLMFVVREGDPLVATVRFMPDDYGLRTVEIGLDGGPRVSFWQMVFP